MAPFCCSPFTILLSQYSHYLNKSIFFCNYLEFTFVKINCSINLKWFSKLSILYNKSQIKDVVKAILKKINMTEIIVDKTYTSHLDVFEIKFKIMFKFFFILYLFTQLEINLVT